MKIYTKKGDKGNTFLYSGKKVSKDNPQIEAYGNIDELNSLIGFTLSKISQKDMKRFLSAIQQDLFTISAYLAGFTKAKLNLKLRVTEIEKAIDNLDQKLPRLTKFIIPGGGYLGSTLHLTRTVARRVERSVVAFLKNKKGKQEQEIIIYLNRLSDFLFVLARFANFQEKIKEEKWE